MPVNAGAWVFSRLQAQLQRIRRLAVRHLRLSAVVFVAVRMWEILAYPDFLDEFAADELVPKRKLIKCPLDECRIRQPDAQVITLNLAATKHLLDREYRETPRASVAGWSV